MLRLLNGSQISDQISASSLLAKFNMLSVSQINAQIKLSEMWKAVNDVDHPFNITKKDPGPDVRAMRSISNEVLTVLSFSELSKKTFINDVIRAWNNAPNLCEYFVTIHTQHKIRSIRDASSSGSCRSSLIFVD